MKTSINYEIIHQICEEVASFLEDIIIDEPDKFPYTMVCVNFMEEFASKGKQISFDQFDSEIIDVVYKEFGESLLR